MMPWDSMLVKSTLAVASRGSGRPLACWRGLDQMLHHVLDFREPLAGSDDSLVSLKKSPGCPCVPCDCWRP